MRKKSTSAARNRTPPAMPTPRPTLRPVFEEVEDEEEGPLLIGALEFEEDDVGAEGERLEEVADVVGLVLLVDVDVDVGVGVDVDVDVDPTYSTVVGTDATTWAVVVGV